jgi:predicted RNase H-like nuclease
VSKPNNIQDELMSIKAYESELILNIKEQYEFILNRDNLMDNIKNSHVLIIFYYLPCKSLIQLDSIIKINDFKNLNN